jgi:hypothetical protein
VLTLGAVVSFAGAVLALWLVRERDIERAPVEAHGEGEAEVASLSQAAAGRAAA